MPISNKPQVKMPARNRRTAELLTPWFNATVHSPTRDGWYDCNECNTRHYFKDGRWYRNEQSLRLGNSMLIQKMHWRGLLREPLESMLSRCDPTVPMSEEERAWDRMAPVGMEFGSPDFERRLRESPKEMKKR